MSNSNSSERCPFCQSGFVSYGPDGELTCLRCRQPRPATKVVPISDAKPHFVVMAMCMICSYRWIGIVVKDTSLYKLECKECGACESFASFVPPDYTAEHMPR